MSGTDAAPWDPEHDPDENLGDWTDRLELTLANYYKGKKIEPALDRVRVVAETGSTQDAALEHAGGRSGLVMTCGVQTSGRGRFGRAWEQPLGLGVSVTFVLEGARYSDDPALSLASGLAACRTCEWALGYSKGQSSVNATLGALGGGLGLAAAALIGKPQIGLRWPNDVVERKGLERKLSGVLIERSAGHALVGIGINTHQEAIDWPDWLLGSAASLRELRPTKPPVSRYRVLERLTLELLEAIELKPKKLAALWQERNVLVGNEAVFDHAGEIVEGAVKSIDPMNRIVVKTKNGERHLPAAQTTLLHHPDDLERFGERGSEDRS